MSDRSNWYDEICWTIHDTIYDIALTAGLCRSARRYGGRWCVIPASPIAQHPPKNRLSVELTRRELCSGQRRRTRHWPRVDSQPVVQALAVDA